jgi:phosphoglycerate kinase
LNEEVIFGGDPTQNPETGGKVVLFENLRFNLGEEENSPEFVQALVKLGDLYVNESFATSHRAHASIVGVPKYRPHFAGLNLLTEIGNLTRVLTNPARPLVVIIGGVKVETKRPVVEYMQAVADEILLGGAFVNESLDQREKIVLPLDTIEGNDIGAQTLARFKESISQAKTIVWNGPMGKFEDPAFSNGTTAIARAITSSSAFSIVGGGDTISALDQLGLLNQVSFISTGGGAMLEFLSGKSLPGLEALG